MKKQIIINICKTKTEQHKKQQICKSNEKNGKPNNQIKTKNHTVLKKQSQQITNAENKTTKNRTHQNTNKIKITYKKQKRKA